MHTCIVCGGTGPFRSQPSSDRPRGTCKACEAARKRELRASPSIDIEVELPPELIADRAVTEHTQAAERRDARRELGALVGENKRLRAELAAAATMGKPVTPRRIGMAPEHGSEAIACALASDWHVEELVEAGATQGLNAYSPEIARARSEAFFRNFLRLSNMCARESKITTLWIGMLGDFFSGWIHEELMAGTAMAPADAAYYAQTLWVAGIQYLLEHSAYHVVLDCVPGNHGRLTDRVHRADPTGTSLETLAYRMLAARFADEPRVTVDVAEHGEVHRRFFDSFRMRLIHGYEVSYGGGVGGITIPLNKRLAQLNDAVPCQLTCLGHFHQRLSGPKFLVNGSLIGHNAYAQSMGFAYSPPVQTFFLVHNRHGGERTVEAPIWLDK